MMKRMFKRVLSLYISLILLIGALTVTTLAAKKVRLNKTSVTLSVGEITTLKLNGSSIKSASSSNKKVASINNKGKVTAKKKGKATITITGTDKKKYKCKVIVGKRDYYVGQYQAKGVDGYNTLFITKKNNYYYVEMSIKRLCYLELSGKIIDGKLIVDGLDPGENYMSGVITKKGKHIRFTIKDTSWHYFDDVEYFEFDYK